MTKKEEDFGILETNDGMFANIKIVKVTEGFNLRQETEADEELKESVKNNGVIQPLIVRVNSTDETDPNVYVIDGHRRLAAAKAAKLDRVPVVFQNVDDSEATIIALTSQTQRPFSPVERAAGLKRLKDSGLTEEAIAKKLGLSVRTVSETLRIEENTVGEIKEAEDIPARVKARASGLSKENQKLVAEKLKGKNREEGFKEVRKAEAKEGKVARGKKPLEITLRKNLKEEILLLSKRVDKELKGEPKSLRFKVIRDVVDFLKGVGSMEDLITGNKK